MSKYVIQVSQDEVPHLTEESRKAYEASLRPHERAARTRGTPSLGAGAIYPVPEEDLLCDPFEIPPYWRHVYGLDVGWNRTAAVWGAYDPEGDVVYLYSEHYRGEAEPPLHAQAIQARGKWIPGTIDPAARGRGQGDGQQLLAQYVALGLVLVEAENGVESGIYEVWTRMSSGRLKIFKTLQNLRNELRIYRRNEKGQIVKDNDHLMDALRYLCVTGINLSAQRPPDQWHRLVPGRPQHQFEYNPMAQSYKPAPSAGPAGNPPRNYLPGRR